MTVAKFTVLLVAAAFALCGVARAQDGEKRDDALDLTMTLLPEHATGPEEITRRIELPPAPEAGERAKPPDDDAKPTDEKSKQPRDEEAGHAAAEDARERGKEVGKDASEQARENRENAGHGNNGNGNNDSNPGKGPPPSPPGRP